MTANTAFPAFLKQRAKAASAYVNGDANLLHGMLTTRNPATFLSPGGDRVKGARKIAARYAKDAKSFSSPSVSRLQMLRYGSSGDLAYWTGLQHAKVRMKGKSKPIAMVLRITEIFRCESGDWKLIHRHADMQK